MNWDKIEQLLKIAEMARGHAPNTPIDLIRQAAETELTTLTAQPIEDETSHEVEETEEEDE